MNDADRELTRKAIEELMREAEEEKERNVVVGQNQERKVNPLGKTNKHFLGRTINAIVKHNIRTEEQNRRNCRKKLKELDRRERSRSRSENRRTKRNSGNLKVRRRLKTKDRKSGFDDSSKRRRRKHLKSKRKRKHKRSKDRRRASSSSSGSSHSCTSPKSSHTERRHTQRKVPRRRSNGNEVAVNEEFCEVVDMDDENYSALMMQPLLWHPSIDPLYQFKTLMALGAAQAESTEKVQIEELSLSSSSLSDVNFDEVNETKSSFKDMLTIDLSIDDDEDEESIDLPNKRKNSPTKDLIAENNCIELSDSGSDDSKNSSPLVKVPNSDGTLETAVYNLDSDSSSEECIISLMSTDSNIDINDE